MIRDETFVFIGLEAWQGLWRSTHEIAWRLAERNRVLFFAPGRDPSQPILAEAIRNAPNLFLVRAEHVGRGLTVIRSPATIPLFIRYLPAAALRLTAPVVVNLNTRVLARHVRKALRAHGVERPVLWLSDPRHVGLVGQLGEKLACYYNSDDVADFRGNARIAVMLAALDERLCRSVDVVLATSQAQLERRQAFNPSIHLFRHGVDFERFRPAAEGQLPLPRELAGLPRPIIGFAGWMGPHVDARLLLKVARAYPECSLVLLGPETLDRDRHRRALLESANVHLLGRKDPSELPAYLQAFDAALMPFVLGGHLRAAFPLKTHEYLAAGRACVATALPELRPYAHVMRLAASAEEFVELVAVAMRDYGPASIAARLEVARQNTWEQRMEELSEVLEAQLSASRAGRRPAGRQES